MDINMVLLQATPLTSPGVEKGISKIVDSYISFAVLVLVIIAVGSFAWYLFKKLEKVRDAHAAEIKEMNAMMNERSLKQTTLMQQAANLMTTFPVTTADNVANKVNTETNKLIEAHRAAMLREIELIKKLKCKDG